MPKYGVRVRLYPLMFQSSLLRRFMNWCESKWKKFVGGVNRYNRVEAWMTGADFVIKSTGAQGQYWFYSGFPFDVNFWNDEELDYYEQRYRWLKNNVNAGVWDNVLYFDFGRIRGNGFDAGKLSGFFPFISSPGVYKPPAILDDPSLLNRITECVLPKCELLYPHLSQEKLLPIIKDCTIATACLSPEHDIQEPLMELIILFWVVGYAMDDFIDVPGKQTNEKFLTYENFIPLWKWAVERHRFVDFVGRHFTFLTSSREIKRISAFGSFFLQEMERCSPELRKKMFSGHIVNAFFRSVSGKILQMELDAKGDKVSTRNVSTIIRETNAMESYAELVVLFLGHPLRDEVREDILFHCLRNSYSDISVSLNALFGLKKDVHSGSIVENIILIAARTNDICLQDAFNDVMTTTHEAYVDFVFFAEKITKTYVGDATVREYVHTLKLILDGSLYAYKYMSRYDGSSCKISKWS